MVSAAFVEQSVLWLSVEVRCSHILTKIVKYYGMAKKNM